MDREAREEREAQVEDGVRRPVGPAAIRAEDAPAGHGDENGEGQREQPEAATGLGSTIGWTIANGTMQTSRMTKAGIGTAS